MSRFQHSIILIFNEQTIQIFALKNVLAALFTLSLLVGKMKSKWRVAHSVRAPGRFNEKAIHAVC